MLINQFSIAVEESRAKEVRDKLVLDYGVVITKETSYTENLYGVNPITRVYLQCFAPYARFKYVMEYLDKLFDGEVVMTY